MDDLFYALNCWLRKIRELEERDEYQAPATTLHDVLLDLGYSRSFAELMNLSSNWSNDIGSSIDDHFGVECQQGDINTWKINGSEFKAFSREFHEERDRLINVEYEKRSIARAAELVFYTCELLDNGYLGRRSEPEIAAAILDYAEDVSVTVLSPILESVPTNILIACIKGWKKQKEQEAK